ADRAGYDLTGTMVGNEGTFGLVTAITVRLTHLPEVVKTALASFASLVEASEAVSAIIAAGIIPAALEMLDDAMIGAVNAAVGKVYPDGAGAVLLIELDGPRAEVEAQAERVAAICRERQALMVTVARDEAERALLWKGRKEAAGAVGRITAAYLLQDAVVPRSRLPQIMREMVAISRRHNLLFANVFHAGDGNLHPLICYDDRKPGELERAQQANEELLHACIALGGTVSGEHGIGMDKAKNLPLQYGEADLNFMFRLRRVFDPDGLMNPAKLLPSHPACGEGFRPSRPTLPAGPWGERRGGDGGLRARRRAACDRRPRARPRGGLAGRWRHAAVERGARDDRAGGRARGARSRRADLRGAARRRQRAGPRPSTGARGSGD